MAAAAGDQKIYFFGGVGGNSSESICDISNKLWNQVQHSHGLQYYDTRAESPAYHAKSATAVVRQYWYIWGGEGLHGHVSDFWRLDFTKQEWELIQPARPDDPIFW